MKRGEGVHLRVISTPPMSGELNMALDVVLAERVDCAGCITLRFFRWAQPTVTMGRTTPAESEQAALAAFGVPEIVRRPTGGGFVMHDGELSLSLCWPRRGVKQLENLRDSYCLIHGAVRQALDGLGVYTRLACELDEIRGPYCASAVVRGDLVTLDGAKVLGGAQWRLGGAVLYQGHLWLEKVAGLEEAVTGSLADVLGFAARPDEAGAQELAEAQARCRKGQGMGA